MRNNFGTDAGRRWLAAGILAASMLATAACEPVVGQPPQAQPGPGGATQPASPTGSPSGGHDGHSATASPTTPGGPPTNPYFRIDASRIPAGSAGSPDKLVRAGGQPGPSEGGEFRTVCTYSHMNFDDPIVFPGRPNASHLHTYFGNTATNYASTVDSIANTGNGTCRGGVLNRSAYWVPALVDVRTGTPLKPTHADMYYKNGVFNDTNPNGLRPAQIQPMPKGLRMVAGDAKSTVPQTRRVGQWGCDDGTNRPYQFWDHIPDYCTAGNKVTLEVNFPQCWNGKDLDSPDHRSHLAYAEVTGCPATHPVPLPQISILPHWLLPAGATAKDVRLSSDMYDLSKPGGYSWHGDWFDGWDVDTKNSWIRTCNQGGTNCYSDIIAPGRAIYGEL